MFFGLPQASHKLGRSAAREIFAPRLEARYWHDTRQAYGALGGLGRVYLLLVRRIEGGGAAPGEMAEYGDTSGWKKPKPGAAHDAKELHVPHIPSRNTYVEIKVTSEEWWLITFQLWVLISFALITRAIMHNVVTGWHCPRNCDAFLTPFAACIATFVVPTCVCCPIMGAKGVWWCYIKRKADDDEHREIHRMRKKCCCLSISWIPKKHPTNQKKNTKHHKQAHDSDSHLPSYVKPGTGHDMDRDPGSPGRKRQDGSIQLPPMTPRLAEIAKQTANSVNRYGQPEPEPEPELQLDSRKAEPFAASLSYALEKAAQDPSTARVAAAQRAVLTGPGQNLVDVQLETAPRPLTRERGATIDDMDRVGITASRRAVTSSDFEATSAGQYAAAPMPLLAPALAPAPQQAPVVLGASNSMLLARPGLQPYAGAGGRARAATPPRLGSAVDLRAPPMIPGMSQPAPQNVAAAQNLLAKFRTDVNAAPPAGGGADRWRSATMNL